MLFRGLACLATLGLLSAPAYAQFDWSGQCGGSGSFVQQVAEGDFATVGEIPANKKNVRVELTSVTDVDIQLIDQETGVEVVAWPGGLLNGPSHECVTHRGVRYCYSGYNGDQTYAGLGNESISIEGVSNTSLLMRVFGYRGGNATVDYSFESAEACVSESGDGAFAQWIAEGAVTTVGDIPTDLYNVEIILRARDNRDVDIQLKDGDTEVIAWPNGMLNGAGYQEINYRGMKITWSGYNGINGQWGYEKITITGRIPPPGLTMLAYGYQAGFADITYAWGVGVGATCLGIATLQCAEPLVCKEVQVGVSDPAGKCHTPEWCRSDATASMDCANIPHIMVPGSWGCVDNRCVFQTGVIEPTCPTDPNLSYLYDPQQCTVVKYWCGASSISAFGNDCGCGCDCPEFVNCMPGPNSNNCDADIIKQVCPNTQIAY